jgi:hypothetical protein
VVISVYNYKGGVVDGRSAAQRNDPQIIFNQWTHKSHSSLLERDIHLPRQHHLKNEKEKK